MKLGRRVGLDPRHIVLDGDPAHHPPKGSRAPKVLAHICCGQIAAGVKMPLGMEVGLGPGVFVLNGDPAPPPKRGIPTPPNFFSAHVYCGYTAGWIKIVVVMDQDATWYGGRPKRRRLCVRWEPRPFPKKVAEPPNFRPIFIVAKRLDGSRWHLAWR